MSKRGRPKNEAKPWWVLHRTMLALCGYDKERRAGEKYDAGLRAGIAEVHRVYPNMPISMTEMKRILRGFRPKTLSPTYFVVESEQPITLDGITYSRVWDMNFGPRPNYPRHNAREDQAAHELAS